ncbi:hypothetical protein [Pedobacter jejuensis]|uniref:hypothetical protein n=1 Tax=Pedobacter jejuensis TaxID=1268550 RepID=UPI0011CE0412|nr:hypothetical protein [Pedobacter jejuensis]
MAPPNLLRFKQTTHEKSMYLSEGFSILTGKSLAQAQRVLRNLRFVLNKRRDQYITFDEYANFFWN